MRRRLLAAVVATLATCTSLPAGAHEGGMDARGVVKRISDGGLTITTKGGEKSFALTPQTRFIAGKRPATRAELKVGDRVVVHAKRDGPRPEAIEVRGAPREADGHK
jgi:Domain of unknown function (DUF5666)